MTTPQQAIQNLYDSPWQMALCLTGGGSRIASDLLTVPGASSTILDIAIPYSNAALTSYLQQQPDQFCSRKAALSMSTVAWQRAMRFSASAQNDAAFRIGISCTASLASSRPKRGDHRIWIATESAAGSRIVSLLLKKGRRTRLEEEKLTAALLLYSICDACGITLPLLPTLDIDETISIELECVPPLVAELRSHNRMVVWSLPDGSLTDTIPEPPRGLLSGSFNPLHVGHRRLRSVAEEFLDGPVHYELPFLNADKPPLNSFDIEQRRQQFDDAPVALSTSPGFVEKARLFPGTTFVIGFDTAERILQRRFYHNSEHEMRTSLEAIGSLGCHFLVAGRLTNSGFQSVGNLPVPTDFQDLFLAIPEERFREDISSSGIRNAASER
ncbi:MAG: CinA family protein [Rhodopirellula sp.]|nr:CinA family protein [Rhodopirellula sp.]